MHVATDLLDPPEHPNHPPGRVTRDSDFVRSIESMNMLEPILATAEGNRYRIVDGLRRLEAAVLLGMAEVPIHVAANLPGPHALAAGVAVNTQREPMPPTQQWRALAALEAQGMPLDRAAAYLGMDVRHARRLAKLGQLHPELLEAIAAIEADPDGEGDLPSDGWHSTIEWTDATWNPITGCSVVSPGCTNCYAMGLAGTRLRNHPSRAGLTRDTKAGPVWTGEVRLNEEWLDQPLRWKRPRRIFVCAHGDLFHEDVPDEWIDTVFGIMALASHHQFQVLTKRSKRMRDYFAGIPDMPDEPAARAALIEGSAQKIHHERTGEDPSLWLAVHVPLPNVWLGVSAEDQQRANERVPDLLTTPAAIRYVSGEPLLGRIDFRRIRPDTFTMIDAFTGIGEHMLGYKGKTGKLDWIIAGGESGKHARPSHPDWFRSLRDQCRSANVPFFFKQWGEFLVGEDPAADDPRQPNVVFADGDCFVVASDGHDIILAEAEEYRGPAKQVWREYWASGTGTLLRRVGKARAGALLDGREWGEMPR